MANERSDNSSNSKNYGLVAVLMAVLAFFGFHKAGSTTPQQDPSSAHGRDAAATSEFDSSYATAGLDLQLKGKPEFYRPVYEYFNQGPKAAAETLAAYLSERNAVLDGCLIATTFYPVQTSFSDRFDHMVAALQRALAATGYVFDSYWSPWEHWRHESKKKQTITVRAPIFEQ